MGKTTAIVGAALMLWLLAPNPEAQARCCGPTCCIIDGMCRMPGTANPDNACQVCDASMSSSAWTDVPGCTPDMGPADEDMGPADEDMGPASEDMGTTGGTDSGPSGGTDAGSAGEDSGDDDGGCSAAGGGAFGGLFGLMLFALRRRGWAA